MTTKSEDLIEILQAIAESLDTIAQSVEGLNEKFARIIDEKDAIIVEKPENRTYPEEKK